MLAFDASSAQVSTGEAPTVFNSTGAFSPNGFSASALALLSAFNGNDSRSSKLAFDVSTNGDICNIGSPRNSDNTSSDNSPRRPSPSGTSHLRRPLNDHRRLPKGIAPRSKSSSPPDGASSIGPLRVHAPAPNPKVGFSGPGTPSYSSLGFVHASFAHNNGPNPYNGATCGFNLAGSCPMPAPGRGVFHGANPGYMHASHPELPAGSCPAAMSGGNSLLPVSHSTPQYLPNFNPSSMGHPPLFASISSGFPTASYPGHYGQSQFASGSVHTPYPRPVFVWSVPNAYYAFPPDAFPHPVAFGPEGPLPHLWSADFSASIPAYHVQDDSVPYIELLGRYRNSSGEFVWRQVGNHVSWMFRW